MKNTKTVVGINVKEGKNGLYTLISYLEPYSAYDVESGKNVVGMKAAEDYYSGTVDGLKPNDEVIFVYGRGFQGKAVLEDVIIAPAGK